MVGYKLANGKSSRLKFNGINNRVEFPITVLPTGDVEVSMSVKLHINSLSFFQSIIGYGGLTINLVFNMVEE